MVAPLFKQEGWKYPEDRDSSLVLNDEEIDYFTDNNIKPYDTCKGCDEYLIDIYREYKQYYPLEEGRYSLKVDGFVCGMCIENDTQYYNTVIIYNPKSSDVTKYLVGMYTDEIWTSQHDINPNDLEDIQFYPDGYEDDSPIQFKFVRTDAWRGHHDPVPPEGWINYHSDCILSYSEDAKQLKEFDVDIKKMLWDSEIPFALCFGRTSNVFSCGYDILIKADEDQLKMLMLVMKLQQLKIQYRDRGRFMRTALTGSSEDTKESRLLVRAHDMLKEGKDFEEVKEEILEAARK